MVRLQGVGPRFRPEQALRCTHETHETIEKENFQSLPGHIHEKSLGDLSAKHLENFILLQGPGIPVNVHVDYNTPTSSSVSSPLTKSTPPEHRYEGMLALVRHGHRETARGWRVRRR